MGLMQAHEHHQSVRSKPREELQFKVGGMHCAACAANVQRAIESRPGVTSAAVSVSDGRATVGGAGLDARHIVQAIEKAGYQAEPIEDLRAPAELRSEIELRQRQHEREWRRRAIVGLSIWAPLEALHWLGKALGWHVHHGVGWMDWVMLLGATAVLMAAGGGFYRSAWAAARRGTTNMDTLIAMGATTAYVFSLVVFIMKLAGHALEQPLYFTESAALLGIISLGHWLEARAAARAGSAVRELLELQPDQAEILDHRTPGTALSAVQQPRIIPSADVKPGDALLIRPGARVPVDGEVIEGQSDIDESVVTGESMPVRKHPRDRVVAGSLNTTGRLVIRAEVDGRHTTIARIAEMVQRAQSSKADIQRLADRVAAIFVPAVLIIAACTFIGWWIGGDFTRGVISTVTVLIISCPCALGLATPMAVMVGAGAASKRGILVKSAAALETAGLAAHVVFDKTGTLTRGEPTLVRIESMNVSLLPQNDLLRLAAAVEAPSEHPIARAIVRAATSAGAIEAIPPVSDFRAIPGEGVRGIVEGRTVVVRRDDRASARIEVDGQVAGLLMIADDLRADAGRAIERLRSMGLSVMMLSGDRSNIAEQIGAALGLDRADVVAEATPESKAAFIVERKRTAEPGSPRRTLVMVGDGINDAAALAQADLGIAMASGTNIAIESADVVIPGDRVTAVAETIDIARQTLRTIKQNLFFAFFYNAAAIPAAALGLLGPYGPLIAAAAMGLSDITVIGNAIRLKRRLERSR
jgi:Cu+-exporting ATPase